LITITRRLAGQLRTVFRQALNLSPRGFLPPLAIGANPAGLRIRCRTAEAAVEYSTTEEPPRENLVVPFELLADCEGRRDAPVHMEERDGRIVAQWQDGQVPQIVQYDAETANPDWPTMPERLAENPADLLRALHDAGQTSDSGSIRFALGCLQLQGAAGKIVATDGRQLLVQRGFAFPWEEEVLVPASKLFGSAQLPEVESVQVGRTADWFVLKIGPFTCHLAINKDGRFPKVEDHIQRPELATATLEIPASDREFLAQNLPRLPSDDTMNDPVTVDLNGKVVLRAKEASGSAVTELILSGSTRSGEPVRFHTNRRYLARAARLGFDRLHVFSPKTPVLACDDHRQYVWALLDPESAFPSRENAVRIESATPADSSATTVSTEPVNRRRTHSMKRSRSARTGPNGPMGPMGPLGRNGTCSARFRQGRNRPWKYGP